jgi:hypothetical protein
MADDVVAREAIVPITGRRLTLPPEPLFALQRAGDADYDLGAFRAWAGYRDLGSEAATDGLALFQHVVSFGPSEVSGRTGVHCHLAHVHIVIPTSGRGVFSYDGVITEAVPGTVIVQHGGTVHDQFAYSYAAGSPEENKATPMSVEADAGAATRSFGFLELFVPGRIANVEIVPPAEVTPEDQATAWDHPYHAAGARFAMQDAGDAGAGFRPVAGRANLSARDCGTWDATGRLAATWIIRPAGSGVTVGEPIEVAPPDDAGGVSLLFMAAGAGSFRTSDGTTLRLAAGDCLTCSAGLVGLPSDATPDMRLVLIHLSGRAQRLRERTPEEIERLERLGPRIVTRREIRSPGDTRPVNTLRGA